MRERVYVSVELKRCWTLAMLLLTLYLAAAAVALTLDLPLWIRAGLIVTLAWFARENLRRHALLSAPGACLRLRLRDDGECWWQSRDGAEHIGMLSPRWFATPWLTVLRVTSSRPPRTADFVLTPCKIDGAHYRQLRVLLAARL